jgi:flagellar biosynthetic protein FlhB
MAEQTPKDEKTEEATGRRLDEARERGQVAFSTELMTGSTLAAAGLTLLLLGTALANSSGGLVKRSFIQMGRLGTRDLGVPEFEKLVSGATSYILPSFLGLVLPAVVVAILVGYAQIGVQVAPKAVAFDLAKLDPIQGLKRIFSAKAVMRTLMSGLKIVLIMSAVGFFAWRGLQSVAPLAGADLGPAMAMVGRLASKAAIAGVVVILVLSVFDIWFQRGQFSRDMRMSKKEIKDEHKSSEGDPLVRSRIRQLQREVASKRMMEDVPKATVVVTNPTHFAVALSYENGQAQAPRVVAKGVDEVAAKIREVAREAGVLLYEDPPLARALHREVQIGDEIPEDLFQAVAGVLAYVYRLRGSEVAL